MPLNKHLSARELKELYEKEYAEEKPIRYEKGVVLRRCSLQLGFAGCGLEVSTDSYGLRGSRLYY